MHSPLTIERIEVSILDLPTIRPHQLSMTTMRKQTLVLIKIVSESGLEGYGESTTIGGLSYGEESPEGIRLTLELYIIPLLLGKDASNINGLRLLIDKEVQGNSFAKAGIETALFDLLGKHLQVSVSTLLGGSVQDKLPVLWTLASGDTQKDIEEAKALIAEGRHHRFKLKIGAGDPEKDVKHVVAIKKALPDSSQVTVDINQAWNFSQAKKWIQVLEKEGIDLIEQPLNKTNFQGLADLTKYFHVPIMADEALRSVKDALDLSRIGGGSVFAVKIMKSAGLLQAKTIAGIAQASDIALYGGTMLEGSIGTIASLHTFGTFPQLSWGTELFGPLLLTDDIIETPLEYKDGHVAIPKGHGLGITIDQDKVKFYKRD